MNDASVVSASKMRSGSEKDSVFTIVRCTLIEAKGCILVNVVAKRIVAPK